MHSCDLDALFLSISLRSFFLILILLGVTSTNSSSFINSSACSSEKLIGGVRTIFSSFPDATFSIDHISYLEEPNQYRKAAIRWSLNGVHSGSGYFGVPSQAEVHIMAISHVEFGPRGIKNEWILFDETEIWKQILMKTG